MQPEEIIDRWENPQFKWDGNYNGAFVAWRQGTVDNPVCGDTCIMYVKLAIQGHLEGGVTRIVQDARHQTEGCTICCCAADLLCEHMIGKPVDFEINLFELLGVPIGTNRRQCVLTPLKALKEATK